MIYRPNIKDVLKNRILVLDGAMGSLIQEYKLSDADYRGEKFKDFPHEVKGNNDMLSITRPDVIKEIHAKYFEAGADIAETNTFSGTSIAMADYHMEDYVYELNYESAKIAREVADEFTAKDPSKPRYVTGSIGPTNRTLSLSPDVNDPGFRAVTFDELVDAYYEQIQGLMDGGADLLLVETIFDTLNAKAALFAIDLYQTDRNKGTIRPLKSYSIPRFGVRNSMFDVRFSMFDFRCSIFVVRCSILGHPTSNHEHPTSNYEHRTVVLNCFLKVLMFLCFYPFGINLWRKGLLLRLGYQKWFLLIINLLHHPSNLEFARNKHLLIHQK